MPKRDREWWHRAGMLLVGIGGVLVLMDWLPAVPAGVLERQPAAGWPLLPDAPPTQAAPLLPMKPAEDAPRDAAAFGGQIRMEWTYPDPVAPEAYILEDARGNRLEIDPTCAPRAGVGLSCALTVDPGWRGAVRVRAVLGGVESAPSAWVTLPDQRPKENR